MEEVVDEDDLQPKAANTDGDDIFVTLRETAQHFADKMKVKKPLTKGYIPRLKQQWYESCKDIMGGVPERLPPLREVNHKINLINDNKVYGYHYPRCPDLLKVQLLDKLAKYKRLAGGKTNVSPRRRQCCAS